MEVINAPILGKKPSIKPILIILIVLGASLGIAIPILLKNKDAGLQKGFHFIGFSIVPSDNTDETVTMNAEFQYLNDLGKQIRITTSELTFFYKSKDSINWKTLFSVESLANKLVDLEIPTNFSMNFKISNTPEDELKRFLFSEIIRKGDYTIRISGKVQISPLEAVDADFPTYLELDIIKTGSELFHYDIPSLGVSTFTLVDIITQDFDWTHPDDYKMNIVLEYKNILPFPISFHNLTFSLINRTEDGNMGQFDFIEADLGEISSNSSKNFTKTVLMDPNQMGWIVSDLISSKSDVIKILDLTSEIYIGAVKIALNDSKQVMCSKLEFELKIVNYYPQGVNLVLDVQLINPTGLYFNITYINLLMYVTGTIQKVVEIDKADLWAIDAYSEKTVYGLVVNAEYDVFIQNLDKNFDLKGHFQANSLNFDGIISFESENVDIIT